MHATHMSQRHSAKRKKTNALPGYIKGHERVTGRRTGNFPHTLCQASHMRLYARSCDFFSNPGRRSEPRNLTNVDR